MIPGLVPGFTADQSTPAASTYTFTLYSRGWSFFGLGYFGFYLSSTGFLGSMPSFGSIDAEPLSGSSLQSLFYGSTDGAGQITFSGNQAATLNGLTVWIGGTEYATGFGAWTYDGSARTSAAWSAGNAPILSDYTTYSVEIK